MPQMHPGFFPPINPYFQQPTQSVTVPNRRGRGRRGRGRGRGGNRGRMGLPTAVVPQNMRGGSTIHLQDTEMLASPTTSLKQYQFNPCPEELPRLYAEAKKYTRYRILSMSIAYKTASSTATDGAIAMGVAVGPKLSSVNSLDAIMKLRPSVMTPVWKNASLNLSSMINSQLFMYCNDESRDGVAFTLYVISARNVTGQIQISYRVELSFPNPA